MQTTSLQSTGLEKFLKGPWPFIIPALFALVFMRAFPFIWQIWLSFTDMRLGRPGNFIGLQNYRVLFQNPVFLDSIYYTVMFMVATVAGQMVLGLILALLLEEDFRGKAIYRMTFLIPWIVSGFVAGILWQLMLVETRFGMFNALLDLINIPPVRWLSNADNARLSVIMVYIWKGLGFSMLLMSGGLKIIPQEMIESADIDGASYLQKLFMIKLPMMKDIISVNLIFSVIAALNSYETVYVLTAGGPGGATSIIALVMFNTAFGDGRNQLGRGSAIGVVMFVVTLIFVIIYVRQTNFAKGYAKQ
jgi:multiple sugar transport system permease protein